MEDEPKLASLLRKGLTAQGLAADVATDAERGHVDGDGYRVRRDHPGRDASGH